MPVLSGEEAAAGGVQGRRSAREGVGGEVDDPARVGFVQAGQCGRRDGQVRPDGVRGRLRSPRPVRHRGRDHRPSGDVREEVPAQVDHAGQVEFVPTGAPVLDAFVACVDPGAGRNAVVSGCTDRKSGTRRLKRRVRGDASMRLGRPSKRPKPRSITATLSSARAWCVPGRTVPWLRPPPDPEFQPSVMVVTVPCSCAQLSSKPYASQAGKVRKRRELRLPGRGSRSGPSAAAPRPGGSR